jgi:hypothetical protein
MVFLLVVFNSYTFHYIYFALQLLLLILNLLLLIMSTSTSFTITMSRDRPQIRKQQNRKFGAVSGIPLTTPSLVLIMSRIAAMSLVSTASDGDGQHSLSVVLKPWYRLKLQRALFLALVNKRSLCTSFWGTCSEYSVVNKGTMKGALNN